MTTIVNLRTHKYDIYIGRGSPFGNPFTHITDRHTLATYVCRSQEESIDKYRQWILDKPELIEKVKKELTGKILGCFCRPRYCHGDVLLEIIDGLWD
jgi:hypothetical protein